MSATPHYPNTVAAAMVQVFVNSWNRAEGAAYGRNYWPDAELVDPLGIISTGRAAIVKEHVQLWASIFKGSRVSRHVRRIHMLGTKYMMVDYDVRVANVRQMPPGTPPNMQVLNNHLKHILEERNGIWKVLSAQNTFIASNKL